MKTDYYVYAYINRKTKLPYYIGKGRNNRFKINHGRVSVPKDKSKIVFLESNLTNVGACALERRYIRWYGRKNIDKNGILLNTQEGGEGGSGPISQDAKIKISNTLKKLFKDKKINSGFTSETAREIGKIAGKSKSEKKINSIRKNQQKSLETIRGSIWMFKSEKRARIPKNMVEEKISEGWKIGFNQ